MLLLLLAGVGVAVDVPKPPSVSGGGGGVGGTYHRPFFRRRLPQRIEGKAELTLIAYLTAEGHVKPVGRALITGAAILLVQAEKPSRGRSAGRLGHSFRANGWSRVGGTIVVIEQADLRVRSLVKTVPRAVMLDFPQQFSGRGGCRIEAKSGLAFSFGHEITEGVRIEPDRMNLMLAWDHEIAEEVLIRGMRNTEDEVLLLMGL